MSKEITIGQFFQEIELPDGSYLMAGNGEYLSYDYTGERLVDELGRYGYSTQWVGNYVCYTCGHVCDCNEDEGQLDDIETIAWSSSNPTGEREGE